MAARIEYSEKYQDDCFEYRCGVTGGPSAYRLAASIAVEYSICFCHIVKSRYPSPLWWRNWPLSANDVYVCTYCCVSCVYLLSYISWTTETKLLVEQSSWCVQPYSPATGTCASFIPLA